MTQYKHRLGRLREALIKSGIGTFIVPSSDPHLGEYVPDHWRIIQWLTGFSGSAGTVVVTDSFAGLWTDSRYFIQAEKQISDSGFEFVKPSGFSGNDYLDFIFENSRPNQKIGMDGRLISIVQFRRLEKRLRGTGAVFVTDFDPIADLWIDRPEMPASSAIDHPVKYCGKERSLKIKDVREEMSRLNADYHFLASADDIMWMLNIRGGDLKFTPLLMSYALIGKKQILLFIDEVKIPPKLAKEFKNLGVAIYPYGETKEIIPAVTEGATVLINPATTSVAMFNSISNKSETIEDISIPSQFKAIKNKTEIKNIEEAMVKDGVALIRFFFWFENNLGKVPMTEVSLADKLLGFRSQMPDFMGPSFETISAYNENSALPHYTARTAEGAEIGERGILLVDSGGQYMDGTTDITRTVPVGIPSTRQKKDFTYVLKGHIDLALAKFPAGTKGYQLDSLARRPIWESGLNFGHGTGHGVGFCLNVHEGPQSISPADNKTAIMPGMLTSNEPAVYREGEYGIRIENLILCYEEEETEFGQFLKFDTVSLCYMEKLLIDKSLLDRKEIEWLNSYHSEVYDKLSPYLNSEEKLWLKDKTNPF